MSKQDANHYIQAQSRFLEAYSTIKLISVANEKEIDVIDIQTALRGVLALMDQGFEHLGEL